MYAYSPRIVVTILSVDLETFGLLVKSNQLVMLELDVLSMTIPLEESKLLFYQDCGHPQTIAVTNFCNNHM